MPVLPNLDAGTQVLLAAIVALATVVIAAWAALQWRALRHWARSADAAAGRLAAAKLTADLAERRTQLAELNALTERALWALPAVDLHVAVAAERLAELRVALEQARGPEDADLRRAISGIRSTLETVSSAGRFRRLVGR